MLVAQPRHPFDPGVEQREIETESGGDARVEHAVEVAAEQPVGVHRQAAHEGQVRQVRACLVRGAFAFAGLPLVPIVQIQAHE